MHANLGIALQYLRLMCKGLRGFPNWNSHASCMVTLTCSVGLISYTDATVHGLCNSFEHG